MTYFPTRSSQNTCVRESALPWKFQRANSCQCKPSGLAAMAISPEDESSCWPLYFSCGEDACWSSHTLCAPFSMELPSRKFVRPRRPSTGLVKERPSVPETASAVMPAEAPEPLALCRLYQRRTSPLSSFTTPPAAESA